MRTVHYFKLLIGALFVSVISLLFTGCEPYIQYNEVPNVFISVTAKNKTSQEEVELKYDGSYSKTVLTIHYAGKDEVFTAENTTKILYCKPGDSIELDYYVFPDNETSSWSFSKISNVVIGLDWEKTFNERSFSIPLTIPELPSGKYPITSKTLYELKEKGWGGSKSQNVNPIETTIMLVII